MDLNQSPEGVTLTTQPKVSGRSSSRPLVVALIIGGFLALVILGGIAYKAYGPEAKEAKQQDSAEQRHGAELNAESTGNSVVSGMTSERAENKPPPTDSSTPAVPDLSKCCSSPWSTMPPQPDAYSAQMQGIDKPLSPTEQMRLASYEQERQAMTTPLGQSQSSGALDSYQAQPQQVPNVPSLGTALENAIPGLQQAIAPQVKSHAHPDETAIIVSPAPGAFVIPAGSWIPAKLEMLANSDLSGDLIARVTRDIFDTHDGKRHLLIPFGTKLIGSNEARVAYGQDRLAQVWNVVQFQDGRSIKLGDMNGADTDGSSGVKDRVDNHYGRLLRDAALVTAFAAAIGLTQRNQSLLSTQSIGGSIGQSVGQQLGQMGSELTSRNLSLPPTVELRPGKDFTIPVNRTIVFEKEPFPGL